jgi:hypothetical protein
VVGILNACENFGTHMLNNGSFPLQELKFSIYFSVSVLVEHEEHMQEYLVCSLSSYLNSEYLLEFNCIFIVKKIFGIEIDNRKLKICLITIIQFRIIQGHQKRAV